ncbi:DUF4393 domain-containing protein [Carnobacterium sp. CS13]|uniref:DUF4393 domain-containing protein n=1 Tax=Carnobacterium sp. CS13 TaxID=2800128 RepID=UPI001911A6AF|nr:DUF4393 domain-containing protein [Carnobacterium sp. CS13]QQP71184.1 DUF4393 domain-containing protein [Carnobacterium sp. CS13]
MSFELIPLLTTVGTSLGVSWLAKGESGPLETLNSLWYLVFGKFNESTADKRYEAQINREKSHLVDSANKIAVELGKIPEDCIQEPRENIIKPALEALKTYNSEEELREMFAKLIASSMDSRMNNSAHPSFVEMIKHLSPADAQNLKIIYEEDSGIPTAKIDIISNENTMKTVFSELFLANPDIFDQSIQSSSLINLDRLGLAKIDYTHWFNDQTRYKEFEGIPEFVNLKNELDHIKAYDDSYNEMLNNLDKPMNEVENNLINVSERTSEYPELKQKMKLILDTLERTKLEMAERKLSFDENKSNLKDVKIVPGVIITTSLGDSFCSICLS